MARDAVYDTVMFSKVSAFTSETVFRMFPFSSAFSGVLVWTLCGWRLSHATRLRLVTYFFVLTAFRSVSSSHFTGKVCFFKLQEFLQRSSIQPRSMWTDKINTGSIDRGNALNLGVQCQFKDTTGYHWLKFKKKIVRKYRCYWN